MTEHRRASRGFTLVEVLIVTAVLGLVSVVIAATFVVVIRTNPATQASNDDSRTLIGLTNYLPGDVSSTQPDDIIISGGGPTSCGALPGTSLLFLSWTDFASGTTTEVEYRFADEGGWRILRDECVGGSLNTARVSSVISNDGTNPVTVNAIIGDHDDDPLTPVEKHGVAFAVTTLAGSDQQIDAISDNIPADLPPVVVASSTSTSTTLAVNNAPIANDMFFTAWRTSPVTVNLAAYDPDGDVLDAMVWDPPNPLPAGWTATFTSGVVPSMVLTPDSGATLGAYQFGYIVDDSTATASALIVVTLVDETTTPTTTTTTTTTLPPPPPTTIPCSVTSVSVNPTSVNNGGATVAKLKKDVTVTITKTGSCVNLILAFTPDESGTPPYTEFELSFNDGTEVVVPKDDFSWSDGFHTLEVKAGSGGSVEGSVDLEVK